MDLAPKSAPRPPARRARTTLAGAVLCVAAQVAAAQPPAPPAHDGLHDFDFAIGRWNVHLRKLLHPLTGSTEWVEYEGTSVMTKIWDGRANMEEFKVASLDKRLHIDAQTLRLYDPDTRRWSIWLGDAAHGKLSGPPTVGGFTEGRGEFHDAEDFNGRPILVRYLWTQPTPTSARMEQSFSPDWGRTWEVNWICDLSRPT
jgi:hypothetical protein